MGIGSKDEVRATVRAAFDDAGLQDTAGLVERLEQGLADTDLHEFTMQLAQRADIFLGKLSEVLGKEIEQAGAAERDRTNAPARTDLPEETVDELLESLYPS